LWFGTEVEARRSNVALSLRGIRVRICRNRIARNSSPSFGGAEPALVSIAPLALVVNRDLIMEGRIATKEHKEHERKGFLRDRSVAKWDGILQELTEITELGGAGWLLRNRVLRSASSCQRGASGLFNRKFRQISADFLG
jgi:hypothetical protein